MLSVFFLLLHYFSLCCYYATWQGVAAHTQKKKKKKAVLLRCSPPIGQSSPLKHHYLNQVKKKVKEGTDGILSVAPSGPEEDLFEHCAVSLALHQLVTGELNSLLR